MGDIIRIAAVGKFLFERKMFEGIFKHEKDIELVGLYELPEEGIMFLDEINPDILILTIPTAGHMTLSEIVKNIHLLHPNLHVITCPDHKNIEMAYNIKVLYEYDFLPKPIKSAALFKIIRETPKGFS
ncbi:hypothetical protein AGMMS49975_04910 [Clostridia bacterium]|nr:hypothetical protein AGMMS49975_04910 [Clostridia bacterium]